MGFYGVKRRTRNKPNWTQEECLLLVTLINENKHVLRSRLGPNFTSQMKRDTWENFSKQLNASALTPRTTEEIEKKWNNILSTSKAEISTFRKQSTITGKPNLIFHIFTSPFPLSWKKSYPPPFIVIRNHQHNGTYTISRSIKIN